jgi:hypothetical protein
MFDDIFGGSDDEDETIESQSSGDDEWEVDISVNTGFTKSTSGDQEVSTGGLLRTHTNTLESEADTKATATDIDPKSSGKATSPETPTVTPDEPTADTRKEVPSYDRGTFAFPNNRDFMQKVEARGLNGAHNRVETVYVLAGNNYTTPTDLFRLDNPSYYASATRRSVTSYGRKMAQKVASLYPDGKSPKLIARFHTHPGGSTRPSDADRDSAEDIRDHFTEAFKTTDFEFFQGIHAYKDHDRNPKPPERHSPTSQSNGVTWHGEQYRHELALFGPKFRNPRNVEIK